MMKKYFYLLALVCATSFFTACSDDDDDNTPKYETITFEGSNWNALIDNAQYGGRCSMERVVAALQRIMVCMSGLMLQLLCIQR